MHSNFCPLIFCLLVDITSCIHGLCAGNPSDLLITDCVYTPSGCTRVSPRWCESIHTRIALPASSPPLAYKAPTSWWSLIQTKNQISADLQLEEATFPEQCAKKSVRDDYVRPFSQLVVWKCLGDTGFLVWKKMPLSRSVLPESRPFEVTTLWRGKRGGAEERVRGVRSWWEKWGNQRVILWGFNTGERLTAGFYTCGPHTCWEVHYYKYMINER